MTQCDWTDPWTQDKMSNRIFQTNEIIDDNTRSPKKKERKSTESKPLSLSIQYIYLFTHCLHRSCCWLYQLSHLNNIASHERPPVHSSVLFSSPRNGIIDICILMNILQCVRIILCNSVHLFAPFDLILLSGSFFHFIFVFCSIRCNQ